MRGGVGVEPVTELLVGVPQAGVGQARLDRLQVQHHAGVVGGEPVTVAVGPPEGLRHPDRGVAPDRAGTLERVLEAAGEVGVLERVGHDVGDVVVGVVLGLGGDVEEPFVEEVGDVELVGGGGGVGGDVAGPAEPFVALRAVGGDVEEVAFLAPDGVGDELVDARVGAFEPAGAGHGGVDDDRFEVVGGELAGEAGDLGVPEAVEGEGGLEDVLAAGQDEGVGGFGGAQRPGAELVVFEHLGVPQDDLVTGLAGGAEPDPADQVLAEVQQGLPGG